MQGKADRSWRQEWAAQKRVEIERLKSARPFLRYVAVLDNRTRARCRAYHGTVLPVEHCWWTTHFPPLDEECRCSVQQLSERDLRRRGLRVSDGPPPEVPN